MSTIGSSVSSPKLAGPSGAIEQLAFFPNFLKPEPKPIPVINGDGVDFSGQKNAKKLQDIIAQAKNHPNAPVSLRWAKFDEPSFKKLMAALTTPLPPRGSTFQPKTEVVERPGEIDLYGAKLMKIKVINLNLANVNLSHADLSGAVIRNSSFGIGKNPAKLYQTQLVGADLSGSHMGRVQAPGANFSGANLEGVSLTYADLGYSNFTGAWLKHTNMQGSDLDGANLSAAKITSGKFHAASMKSVQFSGAVIKSADFSKAQLQAASFVGAKEVHPRNVIFLGANLSLTNFTGVNPLYAGNFDESVTKKADPQTVRPRSPGLGETTSTYYDPSKVKVQSAPEERPSGPVIGLRTTPNLYPK